MKGGELDDFKKKTEKNVTIPPDLSGISDNIYVCIYMYIYVCIYNNNDVVSSNLVRKSAR